MKDRPGFGFLMKRKATILSHDQHSANDAVADESAHLSDIDEIIEIEDEVIVSSTMCLYLNTIAGCTATKLQPI